MEKWQALQSLHEDFNAKCMPNVDIFMDENDEKKKKITLKELKSHIFKCPSVYSMF